MKWICHNNIQHSILMKHENKMIAHEIKVIVIIQYAFKTIGVVNKGRHVTLKYIWMKCTLYKGMLEPIIISQ